MNKITVRKLLALDDRKDILNSLIDEGIMDAERVLCITIDKDGQMHYCYTANISLLEAHFILLSATDDFREKIEKDGRE